MDVKNYRNLNLNIVYVVFLFVMSCNHQRIVDPHEISLRPNDGSIAKIEKAINYYGKLYTSIPQHRKNVFFNISEIINDYKYIPLETNENSLIGEIDQIIYDNERIYVLDRFLSKALFVFSIEGKLLFKIQRIGRGIGEYNSIYSFAIDQKNKKIICFADTRRLLIFDYWGHFLKEHLIPFWGWSMALVDSNVYAIQKGYRIKQDSIKKRFYNLVMLDHNIRPSGKYFPLPKKYYQWRSYPVSMTPFTYFHDSTYYIDHYWGNYIYLLKRKSIQKNIKINLGKYQPPDDFWFQDGSFDNLIKIAQKNNYFWVDEIFISEDYILFSVSGAGSKSLKNYLIYNKKNRQTKHCLIFSHTLETGKGFPIGQICATYKNSVAFLLWMNVKIDIKENEIKNIVTKKEYELLKNVKIEDNPIIVICDLK